MEQIAVALGFLFFFLLSLFVNWETVHRGVLLCVSQAAFPEEGTGPSLPRLAGLNENRRRLEHAGTSAPQGLWEVC